jgi:Inner membrane protein YgaP-like, transmembrane domain
MTTERIVRIIAGMLVLASLLLARYHNPNWLWFTAFVGLNLLQSGFTRFCPLEMILKKAGVPSAEGQVEAP